MMDFMFDSIGWLLFGLFALAILGYSLIILYHIAKFIVSVGDWLTNTNQKVPGEKLIEMYDHGCTVGYRDGYNKGYVAGKRAEAREREELENELDQLMDEEEENN